MDTIVLGANGLLGSNVVTEAQKRGYSVSGTFHSAKPEFDISLEQLDIRNEAAVRQIIVAANPEVVVNCAAMTDVDGCEEDPDTATDINAVAPGVIAAVGAEIGCDLVHVSTDYVFDGTADTRYTEGSTTAPIQKYGKSKLAGERAVRRENEATLIPRLSFVYGRRGDTDALSGFPRWVRDELREGNALPLFTDQHVTPSRAGHVAATIFDLVEADATGLVHVASRSCVTPYYIGELIAEHIGTGKSAIQAGTMSDVEREAKRPAHTCLAVDRVEELLGRPQPSIEDDLDVVIESA